jgi:hypothetical protein
MVGSCLQQMSTSAQLMRTVADCCIMGYHALSLDSAGGKQSACIHAPGVCVILQVAASAGTSSKAGRIAHEKIMLLLTDQSR